MNNLYEVRIGNKTYTIAAYSFDNVIGHLYDFATTFKIYKRTREGVHFRYECLNKPHIRLAPKVTA